MHNDNTTRISALALALVLVTMTMIVGLANAQAVGQDPTAENVTKLKLGIVEVLANL
jgi:hypothetical protein